MSTEVLPDKVYTEVFGQKVIASEVAASDLKKRDGTPILFKGAVKLLVDDGKDGKVFYGCKWCGVHVEEKIGLLRVHHRYHCAVRPVSERRPTNKKRPPELLSAGYRAKLEAKQEAEQEAEQEEKQKLRDKKRRVTPLEVFAGSARQQPPPSPAGDILAALSKPSAGEALRDADRRVKILTDQRDAWKAKYESLEKDMQQVRQLLKKRGLL